MTSNYVGKHQKIQVKKLNWLITRLRRREVDLVSHFSIKAFRLASGLGLGLLKALSHVCLLGFFKKLPCRGKKPRPRQGQ